MWLGRADIGDQRRLPVGRGAHGDTQLLAQVRASAVSKDRQITLQALAVGQLQGITIGQWLQRLDLRRAAPLHHALVERLPQAVPQPGVFHHVAQRRHALISRAQAGRSKVPTVGNMDAVDRLGTRRDERPQAQALVDLPGAVGQRTAARVIARLVIAARGKGLDQHDLPAALQCALLQRQRQAGTDQAPTDDGDLHTTHLRQPRCARRPSAPRSRRRFSARRR